jgi:glutaredoxin
MTSIVLYGKPGCGLCDHAKEALTAAGIEFDEVDITTDPGLNQELGILIPVVEVDGAVVFEAGMNPADLGDLVQGMP